MKKQNGFISSSSSVSVKYSSVTTYKGEQCIGTNVSNWTTTAKGAPYSIMTQLYDSYSSSQSYSWQSYASTCYERIEYFLEATEKLGEPLSKTSCYFQNYYNYSPAVARENVYNGFVDIVITLPCNVRLAGLELINPWVSSRFDSSYANYWMYLPTKFNIYKVNSDKKNEAGDELKYENDVANSSDYNREKTLRPIRYNRLDQDENLTLLGTYNNINWKTLGSYKCFFKYNSKDDASINVGINSNSIGTATWECKQLVLRIFETKVKLNHSNINEVGTDNTYINNLICDYILEKEKSYGTTYGGIELTRSIVKRLIGVENISSRTNPMDDNNWSFGSEAIRSYKYVKDIKFKSGIDYKLGGLQLLISPDIFSISEMKMYNYHGGESNKVYIGEYDPKFDEVFYYGARTIKQSEYIDIEENMSTITWRHNFNLPPNYLEAKAYIRFHMKYDSFNVGDVIENIANTQNAPLSIKITDNELSVNLGNGIGFLNPTTGEFMSFNNGIGIQMDRPGTYDGYKAALDVGATVVDAGSSVAASITGGCPFQIYFIVKRLF